MTIEKLHVMPSHEKAEDGYSYNSKYVGNVYQIGDQLVFFKEKSTIEYPMKVIQAIKSDILESVNNTLTTIHESISDIEHILTNDLITLETLTNHVDIKLNTVKSDINSKLSVFDNRIETAIKPELVKIDELANISAQIKSELLTIKNELVSKTNLIKTIDDIIDNKLTTVYNNFNAVTKQLVTDAIHDALKDSKRDQSGKLKITTLLMLKEMGLTPDEIIKYSESGLV